MVIGINEMAFQEGVLGSRLTSIKIGGSIRYFDRAPHLERLISDLEWAARRLPVKIIGGGSNLILADAGFVGLLIQLGLTQCRVLNQEEEEPYRELIESHRPVEVMPRYRAEAGEFLRLEDELTQAASKERAVVEVGAGVPWGQLVAYSLKEGLSGLHWYARIPCLLSGAVYNNIHAEKHLLSEQILAVEALNPLDFSRHWYSGEELGFGYDQSRFQQSGEIILRALLLLTRVDEGAAKQCQKMYLDWTKEKVRVQPAGASCGSVFKNITSQEAAAVGQTALAAAWYIDQAGWRGKGEGGVRVYEKHANFIINTGEGTQADFIKLVRNIRESVEERFKIRLEPEAEVWNPLGERLKW